MKKVNVWVKALVTLEIPPEQAPQVTSEDVMAMALAAVSREGIGVEVLVNGEPQSEEGKPVYARVEVSPNSPTPEEDFAIEDEGFNILEEQTGIKDFFGTAIDAVLIATIQGESQFYPAGVPLAAILEAFRYDDGKGAFRFAPYSQEEITNTLNGLVHSGVLRTNRICDTVCFTVVDLDAMAKQLGVLELIRESNNLRL